MASHRRPDTAAVSSALLLTVFILGIGVPSCRGGRLGPQDENNTEFIRYSCTATMYPELCFSSLSAYATEIQTNPTRLAQAALSVSLASARSTSAVFSKVSAGRSWMPPRVAGAMRDCMENLGDSMYELQESMAALGNLRGSTDPGFVINSIQTWVSAALTDENTCMDGFAGSAMNGDVKSMVRSHVVTAAKLTSNALALVNELAPSQPSP